MSINLLSCPPTGMNWTPDKLTSLATGYWHAAALIGAVELSLFDYLDRPRSSVELAAKCGVQEALLVSLLDALVSIELLEKADGRYAIAAGAVALLSRSSSTCMVDALRYNADLYRQWGKLAEVVRTGEPAVPQAKQLGMDEAMTRRFVYGMESKARAFVPAIAPMIELEGAQTLLDVGSGPGTLSRTLAERSGRLKVTLLDLPDVLKVAREICTRSPAAPRLDFYPANYRTDSLPGPFDAVVYAGALHQETPASAERLVQRLFETLRPGGHVYIVDLMLDDSRTAPTFSALFQITMMLIQPAARVFSRAEIVDVLERAGFGSIVARQPDSSPYRLVAARKPE
jgi:2-polyprenyl-3-methyl-5-hydroxy-6-metoxy-1,4-benzoquinol methylase